MARPKVDADTILEHMEFGFRVSFWFWGTVYFMCELFA